jgi:hypothetical protein
LSDDPSAFGDLCLDSPVCYRVEVVFDRTTAAIASIDLYDPQAADPDEVWVTFRPPYTDQATTAALRALRRAARDGEYDVDLCRDGCSCRLSGIWGPWMPPHEVQITGGFSIPNPGPPPARLRYRVNGTVKGKTRMLTGGCYAVRL